MIYKVYGYKKYMLDKAIEWYTIIQNIIDHRISEGYILDPCNDDEERNDNVQL